MEVHNLKYMQPKMTVLINTKVKGSMLFMPADMDLQKVDFAEIIWYLFQKSKSVIHKDSYEDSIKHEALVLQSSLIMKLSQINIPNGSKSSG